MKLLPPQWFLLHCFIWPRFKSHSPFVNQRARFWINDGLWILLVCTVISTDSSCISLAPSSEIHLGCSHIGWGRAGRHWGAERENLQTERLSAPWGGKSDPVWERVRFGHRQIKVCKVTENPPKCAGFHRLPQGSVSMQCTHTRDNLAWH